MYRRSNQGRLDFLASSIKSLQLQFAEEEAREIITYVHGVRYKEGFFDNSGAPCPQVVEFSDMRTQEMEGLIFSGSPGFYLVKHEKYNQVFLGTQDNDDLSNNFRRIFRPEFDCSPIWSDHYGMDNKRLRQLLRGVSVERLRFYLDNDADASCDELHFHLHFAKEHFKGDKGKVEKRTCQAEGLKGIFEFTFEEYVLNGYSNESCAHYCAKRDADLGVSVCRSCGRSAVRDNFCTICRCKN